MVIKKVVDSMSSPECHKRNIALMYLFIFPQFNGNKTANSFVLYHHRTIRYIMKTCPYIYIHISYRCKSGKFSTVKF